MWQLIGQKMLYRREELEESAQKRADCPPAPSRLRKARHRLQQRVIKGPPKDAWSPAPDACFVALFTRRIHACFPEEKLRTRLENNVSEDTHSLPVFHLPQVMTYGEDATESGAPQAASPIYH